VKVAALDLGSNSIHMVVAEVSSAGTFRVLGRDKEMVRLGAGTFARKSLDIPTIDRALFALRRFSRIARNHEVEKTIAVATAAVREAENGEEFLNRVGREIGVWPRVLSGDEEARLIYLSVRHSVNLAGRRALVVDIGGGSVELALGAGPVPDWTASEKLGVLRMTERFVGSDPIDVRDEGRLEQYVQRALERHLPTLRSHGFDVVVGTSGTVLALGGLAVEREQGQAPDNLHHVVVPARGLSAVRDVLVQTDARARQRLAPIGRQRADIVVAGAVVLDTLLRAVGARELLLCEWSLREGALLDFIQAHPRWLVRAEAYPDVRRRSVVDLGERCSYDAAHAEHVAGLALQILDATQDRHGLGAREREWLEYAALLHDVGHHIAYPGHHKHSAYLIREGGLLGFDPMEIEVMAAVARYHRRAPPSRKHAEFDALPARLRRRVRLLSGCLRVAEALDRSHRQVVNGLRARPETEGLRLLCRARGDAQLERWSASGRLEPLEEALGCRVKIEVVEEAAASVSSPSSPANVATTSDA
jgi:exopolyphosphatase / guanosine-5'-triphosphate,3'-diphosphate pyrophosphatase